MIWKPFSAKQLVFLEYLFDRIGFTNEDFIKGYREKLEGLYGRYYRELRTETYQNGFTIDKWIFKYSNSGVIEELLREIDIKKNIASIKLKPFDAKASISATDLANYEYCPASFSISKSFEIEFPTGKAKSAIGKNFHEKLGLIQISKKESDFNIIEGDLRLNQTIKKIKNCELIFSGHNKENKYFTNNEKNYVGQPDYIFKDPNGKFFVVEEKFKFLNHHIDTETYSLNKINEERNLIMNSFFSNHLIQLTSYINYIQDYSISFGVLIYWFYDFENDVPYVHNASTKVILSNENLDNLEKVHNNLKHFVSKKTQIFNFNANTEKCGACVVNKYCAHKTDRFSELKIPYNRYDLNLKFVPFPTYLKRNEDSSK